MYRLLRSPISPGNARKLERRSCPAGSWSSSLRGTNWTPTQSSFLCWRGRWRVTANPPPTCAKTGSAISPRPTLPCLRPRSARCTSWINRAKTLQPWSAGQPSIKGCAASHGLSRVKGSFVLVHTPRRTSPPPSADSASPISAGARSGYRAAATASRPGTSASRPRPTLPAG